MKGARPRETPDSHRRIWRAVAAIPAGRVASYGEVASRAGMPRAARLVGAALKSAPDDLRLPWHRVIRADGRIAFPPGSPLHDEQARRLAAEGVRVRHGRVDRTGRRRNEDLDRLLWGPDPEA